MALLICLVWMWSGPVGASGPVEPLRVEGVDVNLTIWRTGERLPSGERVSIRGARVDAVASYTLSRPAAEAETLVLLDFAEFLAREPLHLDEVQIAGYVAGPFDRGRLTVNGAQADQAGLKMSRVGERRDIQIELPEGATEFTLRYEVDVPHRYWPFGCVRRRCSLSGAVAPLPSSPARGGTHLPKEGRIPEPAQWSVDAHFGSAERADRDEIVVTSGAVAPGRPVAYPGVFWGPRWHHARTIHHGVEVEILADKPRPADQHPDERKAQLRRDHAGLLLSIAREAVEVAEFVGTPLPPDSRLTVVQGPLRSEIAQSHPSAVLLTDQFLELFPWKRFSKFHEVIAARAMFDSFAYSWFVGTHDVSTDHWVAGMVGFALTQIWQQQRELRDEYARDLLRNFTFVPAVDRFLYTGQASFSSAYFRGGEDIFPVRNHPLLFSHELPTGRRIHEKLSDLLAPEKVATFYAGILGDKRADPYRLAERAYGYELDWFFDQWLGTYPEVDYAIVGVESDKVGGGFEHRIIVARDADRELIEPVQILVTERGGKTHYLQWNGEPGPDDVVERDGTLVRHTWQLHTDARLKTVRLDPRYRFAETSRYKHRPWQRGDNNDPRFNNRHPHKGRFLYTGVGGSLAVSEFLNATTPLSRLNALSGFAAFEASLQRDTRRNGVILISKGRESVLSATGAVNFAFLRKRNRQRRRFRLRTGLTTTWLSGASLDPVGGLRVVESIGISDQTQRFLWWPEQGRSLWLTVNAAQVYRLDRDRRDDRFNVFFSGGWQQMWRIARSHVVATKLEVDVTVPIASEPEYRSLQRAGGIGALNGFLADEIFGLASALAQAEYRHLYVDDMGINGLHLLWLRSLGGVLFGGVASVSSCEGFEGWFDSNSYYGQVGYGLTARMQVLGVTPQLLRVDVAVPLGRRQTECLGKTFPDELAVRQGLEPEDAFRLLPPVNINLLFNHAF